MNIEKSRKWVLAFVTWYNQEHKHSGINFLTPKQRHDGLSTQVFAKRTAVYEAAKAAHPERWTSEVRRWELEERVWLNPERIITELIEEHQA